MIPLGPVPLPKLTPTMPVSALGSGAMMDLRQVGTRWVTGSREARPTVFTGPYMSLPPTVKIQGLMLGSIVNKHFYTSL